MNVENLQASLSGNVFEMNRPRLIFSGSCDSLGTCEMSQAVSAEKPCEEQRAQEPCI
jgi:hypothetical protein